MNYDYQACRAAVSRACDNLTSAMRGIRSEAGVAVLSEHTVRRLIDAICESMALYLVALADAQADPDRSGLLPEFHEAFERFMGEAFLKAKVACNVV